MKPVKAPKPAKKPKVEQKKQVKTRVKTEKTSGQDPVVGEKRKVGRPTYYRPEYVQKVYEFCLLGADDSFIARAFDVDECTINRWKADHPEFCKSMSDGKETADAEIAKALYHRAKGYSHDETHVSNYQGQITLTPLIKHYPPDTAAASLWLRNRQSGKWRDKVDVDHGVQAGSTLEAALLSQIGTNPASRIKAE